MGPGYFPRLLNLCLIAIGAWVGFQSIILEGPKIERPKWRSSILILVAIMLFGAMIETTGLLPTTAAVCFVCAYATEEARWKESAILSIGLAAFVVILFVYGLNQPMTIIGSH
jgi:hypothetical protein